MGKLLLVDDDEALRRMVRLSLGDLHEIVDTGVPEEALALALEHKPDAILLDLRMPKYSGFELCQTFTSFSSTQLIPVIVVSGEAGAKTKEFCRELGAVAYFEKPVDFEALTEFIAKTLKDRRVERRSEVRVRLRVSVKLQGKDSAGNSFDIRTVTENVSKSGFLCACNLALENNAIVEVSMAGSNEELVGSARVVRSEWTDALYPRYGFQFIQKTGSWVLD
ncbi:MAG: response regulator [Candidatus Acidiferrum sp.]|jgi:CheY-like chemotaxis protein